MREEVEALEDHTNFASDIGYCLTKVFDADSVDEDFAFLKLFQIIDASDQCRLTRA